MTVTVIGPDRPINPVDQFRYCDHRRRCRELTAWCMRAGFGGRFPMELAMIVAQSDWFEVGWKHCREPQHLVPWAVGMWCAKVSYWERHDSERYPGELRCHDRSGHSLFSVPVVRRPTWHTTPIPQSARKGPERSEKIRRMRDLDACNALRATFPCPSADEVLQTFYALAKQVAP